MHGKILQNFHEKILSEIISTYFRIFLYTTLSQQSNASHFWLLDNDSGESEHSNTLCRKFVIMVYTDKTISIQ